jgi:phage tail sheath gpL-like
MTIAFNLIPTANRVPGPMAEVDGSKALSVPSAEPHRVLIIAKRLITGTAPVHSINPINGELDGDLLFDSKSELAAMTRAFKRVNTTAKLYAAPVDENAGGVAATGTFPLTGTSTAEGSLRVRIGDQRVSVNVPSGTAAAAAATLLSAQINLTERMPIIGSVATATVTTTHRTKGPSGNDITIEVEAIPAGLACTPVQPANGATEPSLATLIGLLDETRYDTIITGVSDAANMLLLENEMTRRWGPTVKKYGVVIAARRGSHATLTSYGGARNSNVSSVMACGLAPTPPWVWAAQVGARDAEQTDLMPNRPRNGLVLPDCEGPKTADLFDGQENNLLLYAGMSTFKTDQSGRVMIERLVTTYQKNIANMADSTYLAIETVRNLAGYLVEVLGIGAKYGRHVIGTDADNFSDGVPVATAGGLKGEFVAHYETMILRGRMKDLAGFRKDLRVEPSATDVERFDVLLPPRFMNGLVTLAMKVAFQL